MLPWINDITTTPQSPPAFARGAIPAYPPAFAELQRKGYPDLQPLKRKLAGDSFYEAALQAARGMRGWEVVFEDARLRKFEAVATTGLLRFKDDVTAELRDEGSGEWSLHVRSRSRVGRSDFGANAKRIRAFLAAVDRKLSGV